MIQIMASMKKKKTKAKAKTTKVVADRISNLPDCLLLHILSFVDTKLAVQTTVLAKRWTHLWPSLPHLTINYFISHPADHRSDKFVAAFLADRDRSVPIHQLRLGNSDASVLETVLNSVPLHGVHEIHARTACPQPFRLPLSVVNHQTLVTLKLSISEAVIDLDKLPKRWDLPALETLYIRGFQFQTKEKQLDLFYGCRSLKNLFILFCGFSSGLQIFHITAPRLADLTLELLDYPFKFVVSAPELSRVDMGGVIRNNQGPETLSVLNAVSLHRVNLSVACIGNMAALFSVFQELCNAKILQISYMVVGAFHLNPDVLEHQISPFRNLNSLEVEVWMTKNIIPDCVLNYFLRSSSSAAVTSLKWPKRTASFKPEKEDIPVFCDM